MKAEKIRWILLALVLFCMCGCAPEHPIQPSQSTTEKEEAVSVQLNIMTFNVYYKDAQDQPVKNTEEKADCLVTTRGPKLLALLAGEQIDVAGLQEAGPAWRYFLQNELKAPYTWFGQYTKSTQEGGYIVYNSEKLTLMEHGYYFLAPGAPTSSEKGWDADHDRLVTWGLFREKKSGVVFLFCDTHFDHAGAQARLESAKVVQQKMNQTIEQAKISYGLSQIPAFLVGDLNCNAGSEPLQQLQTTMTDARDLCEGEKPPMTISSSPGLNYVETEEDYIANSHYIDHIFVSGPVTVQSMHLIHSSTNLCPYGAYISDHNAVIAAVTVQN